MIFETEPLSSPVEILGAASLRLALSVDKPVAMIAARLSDVLPDGSVTRFTYGLLNLTHRNSRERPEPMVPGQVETIELQLNHIAQHLPAGHRIRLSLSTSYWPLAWPAPEHVVLDVHLDGCELEIPLRQRVSSGHEAPPFGESRVARPNERELIEPTHYDWIVHRHLASDESTLEVIEDRGTHFHVATGLTVGTRAVERYHSAGNDISSVSGETVWHRGLERGPWQIRTKTRTVLTSDREHFHVQGDLDAYESNERVFCRTWRHAIPRDLV
jgi:uncharacterized protein